MKKVNILATHNSLFALVRGEDAVKYPYRAIFNNNYRTLFFYKGTTFIPVSIRTVVTIASKHIPTIVHSCSLFHVRSVYTQALSS